VLLLRRLFSEEMKLLIFSLLCISAMADERRAFLHRGVTPGGIDASGAMLIRSFESWNECWRNMTNGDRVIGWGHKYSWGYQRGLFDVDCINKETASAIFGGDTYEFEWCVNRMNVHLNQNEFNALVSFAWSAGCGSLKSIKPSISEGPEAVCEELQKHVHGTGSQLSRMVSRRNMECEMYSGEFPPTALQP